MTMTAVTVSKVIHRPAEKGASTLSPSEIRPLLQSKIDQMSDDQVQSLHRVMQKLEAQQLWDEIKADGARDRAAGKFDQLSEVIAQVRAEIAEAMA